MNATEYIQKLGLEPHPEGGYYRQLFDLPFREFRVLAKRDELLRLYPQHGELIERMCKV